ncbi:hypothetical protein GP486_007984 [Trichoglossum hirsutum]|uniref:Uncharacterized protein n=1 Tax=Trichoglossum hirsutum TaxID=265104 RepID=A0A9P8IEU1_9PEZI|nr:hypothetical protein GP486_007984 [Trichoglossum hirsutum]
MKDLGMSTDFEEPPPPYEERQDEIAPPLYESPAPTSSILVFDGRSVFEPARPSVALYQTSRALDAGGCTMSISRLRRHGEIGEHSASSASTPPVEPFDDDKVIYTVFRPPASAVHLELMGKRRTTYPGTIASEKTVLDWRFWHEHKGTRRPLFRAKNVLSTKLVPDVRWKDAAARTLASVERQSDGCGGSLQIMTVSDGVASPVVDALVACWMAKAWHDRSHRLL